MPHRISCCIMDLNKILQRKVSPCMINLLYNEKTIIGRLYYYFYNYFETFTAPTIKTLILFLLYILTSESEGSTWFHYTHFLPKIMDKSLIAFYYAYSYARVEYSRFMNVTASMTLKLILKPLGTQPVFLYITQTSHIDFSYAP